MNTKNKSLIRSTISLVVVATFLFAAPAWSALGKKKEKLNDSTKQSVLNQDDKKAEGRGKKKAKKKLVKKVGSAAAIGIAGKKIKSGPKGTIKDVAE